MPEQPGEFSVQRSHQGFTLFEVLIALAIFSIGIVGLILLQLRGMAMTRESGVRTIGVFSTSSFAEMYRSNPEGSFVFAGGPPAETACADVKYCTPDEAAINMTARWYLNVDQGLPSPTTGNKAQVVADAGIFGQELSLNWKEGVKVLGTATESDETQNFRLKVVP
jgi:type IV pilus assembly protein PilV